MSHTYSKLGQVAIEVEIIIVESYLSIVGVIELMLDPCFLKPRRGVDDGPLLQRLASQIKALAICNILYISPTALTGPDASILGGHSYGNKPEHLGEG